MLENDRWLLPEGIEELLPADAARVEALRRKLLDLFGAWGYELVIPPLIEYLESLLTGTGNDLDLQTFKLTDQLTGRLMGVRADMTPQVARIDSHRLKLEAPTRLCYFGHVLRTRPQGLGGSRSPLQVGAELYGHRGAASDFEVVSLMVEALRAVGVPNLHLDLAHVGIFRALAAQAGISGADENRLFDALQRKAKPEIGDLLAEFKASAESRHMLLALADLNGGREIVAEAARALAKGGAPVQAALDELRALAGGVSRLDVAGLHFDLAELRGYAYHTGAVFAAFVPGRGHAIAQGGRYDDIGRIFGRARPATGFSMDLNGLLALATAGAAAVRGIFAPAEEDPLLERRIRELRAAGERVIRALPGQAGGGAAMGCDRQLTRQGGQWQVISAVS